MIDAIGFDNFRNFEHFPMMHFGKINFLVGKNNAGKSSITKALRLLMNPAGGIDPILRGETTSFSFAEPSVGISTFNRAKCSLNQQDEIVFRLSCYDSMRFSEYYMEFDLISNGDEPTAEIKRLLLFNKTLCSEIEVTKMEGYLLVKFTIDPENRFLLDSSVFNDAFNIILSPFHKFTVIEHELEALSNKSKGNATCPEASISFKMNTVYLYHDIENLIRGFDAGRRNTGDVTFDEIVFEAKNYHNEPVSREVVKMILKYVPHCFGHYTGYYYEGTPSRAIVRLHYMGSTSIVQKVALSVNDKNDDASQAVFQYWKVEQKYGKMWHRFIEYWMKEFGIGEKFEIETVGGELFWVKIFANKESKEYVYLADKGVGSIRLFFLLLKFASISDYNNTIIIEEPEQNLHPNVQTKLVDLFFDYCNHSSNQIIIETHSEYMIRYSQVKVAKLYDEAEKENKQFKNPFKVFYVNGNGEEPWWELGYNRNGTFKRGVGEGFLDEASNLDYQILERELENQK